MQLIYTTGDGKAYSMADGFLLGFSVDEFVTDRTLADVERWRELHDKGWEAMTPEEQAEWLGGMKGAYNHTDMNRVESLVEKFVARFREGGVNLSLVTKTDWTRSDWPTSTDMSRYFSNVAAIRAAAVVDAKTPEAPTVKMPFDYNRANDIEKILMTVNNWLNRVEAARMYSGDLYLGEV